MTRALPGPDHPLRVAVLSWRDSGHPEGGGSEVYAESVAAGLAARGHDITIFTARYPGSTTEDSRDGYRILRSGGRLTVYVRVVLRLLLRTAGRFDVIVDVQNGTPFFARLVTRRPVVVLCHHVHRDQWKIVFGGSRAGNAIAAVGWFIESNLAPRLLRGCRYITVSDVSKRDLISLGVRPDSISVVHNGTPPAHRGGPRSQRPEVVVLGRIVPHKRIEHAVRAVGRLRAEMPDIRLTIIGQGWWHDEVRAEIQRCGLEEHVDMVGFVAEARKHELLSRAWVVATPSVMEGWGLGVVEAASHGTPAVAYRSAGGLAESVIDGVTGLLAEDDEDDFTAKLARLLADAALRNAAGRAAQVHAERFTQQATVEAFAGVLAAVVSGSPTAQPDRAVTIPKPRGAEDDAEVAVAS